MSFPPALPAALYQGSVNTWECDEGGHLNVRFHAERAFTGLAHMANRLKLPRAFTADAKMTVIPREVHVRFLKEAHPGAPLLMHGGVLGLGEDSGAFCFDMRHADGAPSSAFTFFVSHVDAKTLTPTPWTDSARAMADALSCQAPAHTQPRSIDMHAAPGDAGVALAKDLGAHRIGGFLVSPDQCDAFGRLRGEHIIGRASDSASGLLSRWRQETAGDSGASPAGAVVEARIVYRRWPRAGALVEVYSGVVEVGEKTLRIIHWICDPERGDAWASLEIVALTFDTVTRKAITPSAEVRARMQERALKLTV